MPRLCLCPLPRPNSNSKEAWPSLQTSGKTANGLGIDHRKTPPLLDGSSDSEHTTPDGQEAELGLGPVPALSPFSSGCDLARWAPSCFPRSRARGCLFWTWGVTLLCEGLLSVWVGMWVRITPCYSIKFSGYAWVTDLLSSQSLPWQQNACLSKKDG